MAQAAAQASIRVNGQDEPLAAATLSALLEEKAVYPAARNCRGGQRCYRPARRLPQTQPPRRQRRGSFAPVRAVEELLQMSDPLIIAGREFGSRLFPGTAPVIRTAS